MQRRTDLWGPDGTSAYICPDNQVQTYMDCLALEWDPERFIDERLNKYCMFSLATMEPSIDVSFLRQ
jgi:hypothetical protein